MKDFLKYIVRPAYYTFLHIQRWILQKSHPSLIDDPKKIPIIINNRNRLTTLQLLIKSLERRGYENLFIIDNASTYEPLLEYYKNCPYTVFKLEKNVGFLALWKTNIHKNFFKDYYVYTDSDVVLVDECPDDFLDLFWNTMRKDPFLYKIGLSLKIDDLPDKYSQKKKVIEWESVYYKNKVNEFFYSANVDTTFALYRPWYKGGANIYIKTYRSAFPYQLRHLPWYVDSNNLDEEELFYLENATTTTHWAKKSN